MLKPYMKHLILGFICMGLYLGIRLYFPMLTIALVDDIIYAGKFGSQEKRLLYVVLSTMIGLAILRAFFAYARQLLFQSISQNVLYDIRVGLFEHLHSLPYRFYDNHQVGEVMSRMTGDIESIRAFIAAGIMQIVENTVFYFGSLIIISTLSMPLAGALFIFTPILAIIGYKFDKAMRPKFAAMREQSAVLSSRTQETVSGAKVVKAYARENYENTRFNQENTKQMESGIAVSKTYVKYLPLMEALAAALPATLLLVGGYLVSKSQVTTGTLIAVFGYLWMLSQPMRILGQILNMLTQTIAAGTRIFYYSDFGSYIKDKLNTSSPDSFQGNVSFENVSFSYGDEDVLVDITFEVKAGQTIAVMGSTGSGKTTLVSLLGRFYQSQKGSVKIDGIDVKDYKMKELRSNIGYVMQETFLFAETLRENIAFGKPEASIDEVKAAAKIGQAAEFIEKEDEGYEYVLGERGGGLSGGQKQRTSIARALLIDPKILVLDDSTAAVDMETEHKIQDGLKKRAGNSTTFIISHRISSVKDADLILVLDNGKLIEKGVHSELLKNKGLYYNIFTDQYKDYLDVKDVVS